jgi:hypothetical protein
MGFDTCGQNEQYLIPQVEGLVEKTHYYGKATCMARSSDAGEH